MKFAKRKGVNSRSNFFIANSPSIVKRKNGTPIGGASKKKHEHHKKKVVHFPVQRFKQTIPIEGIDYVMELTLAWDKVYEIRRNHIKSIDDPKLQVLGNKAQELKDEFSTYCGMKKRIKNWLYYV